MILGKWIKSWYFLENWYFLQRRTHGSVKPHTGCESAWINWPFSENVLKDLAIFLFFIFLKKILSIIVPYHRIRA